MHLIANQGNILNSSVMVDGRSKFIQTRKDIKEDGGRGMFIHTGKDIGEEASCPSLIAASQMIPPSQLMPP